MISCGHPGEDMNKSTDEVRATGYDDDDDVEDDDVLHNIFARVLFI